MEIVVVVTTTASGLLFSYFFSIIMDVDATTAADVAQTTVYGLSVFSSYVAAAATVATH